MTATLHPKAEEARERLISLVRESGDTIPVTLCEITSCAPRAVYEALKQDRHAIWDLTPTEDDDNDYCSVMLFVPMSEAAPVVMEEIGLDVYELMAHLNTGSEAHNYLIDGFLRESFWWRWAEKPDDAVWIPDRRLQLLFRVLGLKAVRSAPMNVGDLDANGVFRPARMRAYRSGDVFSNEWPECVYWVHGNDAELPDYCLGDDRSLWPERLRQRTLELVSGDPEWCEEVPA